jgi:hypothetical protein
MGKPAWRPLLRYVAELHARSTHPPRPASGQTCPPVWPLAVQELAAVTGEDAPMRQAYPYLSRQIGWFERHRAAAGGGFYYADILTRRWESGIDEGVRFDEAPPGPRACVDATSHLILVYDLAARWAPLLGEPGEGFGIALDFFMHSRPQVAASAVGIARAAFEYATGYANERRAFGKPLIAKQGVSFKLADMAMQIEAARLLVWRAAAALDAGHDAGLFGSYAKAFAADVAMSVSTDAVQVLGGAGIMRDHLVEKWMRDAKVLQIVEGTSEIQRHVITQYLRR